VCVRLRLDGGCRSMEAAGWRPRVTASNVIRPVAGAIPPPHRATVSPVISSHVHGVSQYQSEARHEGPPNIACYGMSVFHPFLRRSPAGPPRRLMAAFPTLRAVLRAPQARLVDALGPADGRALFAFLRRTAWADAKEGGGGGAGAGGGGGQAPPPEGVHRLPVQSGSI